MAPAQQDLPARIVFSRSIAPLFIILITVLMFEFMQRLGQWEGRAAQFAQFMWTHGAFDPFTMRHPNDWRWPQTVSMFLTHGVLHINLLHLLSNMVPLTVLGTIAALRVGG